ncbi:hypothetical protein QFC20_006158 [Naganishia adeliensis]|uniref:Uncharacterized protein n=1 Tax=Naganishia adeliensis TaxID=92952 RepID=A0ACC2VF95_9TREE|nr:hypothetical protein QFC20_006158 [Naganishia adeliensis]
MELRIAEIHIQGTRVSRDPGFVHLRQLDGSSPSSSFAKPMVLDEDHEDIETLLIMISGHPCEANDAGCPNWETAKRLYRLMQKYQLDSLGLWFTMMAGDHVGEAPLEALCLACNNPCFDEELVRSAILYGIEELSSTDLFDPDYFVVDDHEGKSDERRKACLLNPRNARTKLSLDLGYKGWFGYCKAFSTLSNNPD